MPDNPTVYIEHQPGDLITAEDWNAMQIDVKQDIATVKQDIATQVGTVQKSLDEFKAKPIDAPKFDGKTRDEWTKTLDDRYVQKSESESGWGQYRRYFKQLNVRIQGQNGTTSFQPAIIQHDLHRYPLVELSELIPFSAIDLSHLPEDANPSELKFLIYYASRTDKVSDNLRIQGEDVVYMGDPLPQIMEQFGMPIDPSQPFVDLLNDLWDKMFDPGLAQDNFRPGTYGHSKWIQEQIINKDKTIGQLQSGIWDDLRMAIRPQILSTFFNEYGGTPTSRVQSYHLSQDALAIEYTPPSDLRENNPGLKGIDLMVILRT